MQARKQGELYKYCDIPTRHEPHLGMSLEKTILWMGSLEDAAENPAHYFTRLVGDSRYRLHVGDYRVIVRIERNQLLILVINVGHLKNMHE